MRDYLKGITLLFGLWAILACGTFATTQSHKVYDVARASARTVCSYGITSACKTLARFRARKAGQPTIRS